MNKILIVASHLYRTDNKDTEIENKVVYFVNGKLVIYI